MRLECFRQRGFDRRLLVEAELFAFSSRGLARLGKVDHLDSNHVLSTDRIHVPRILPSLLDPWHVPDTLRLLPDCLSNERCKLLIIAAVPEDWFQVVIFSVE